MKLAQWFDGKKTFLGIAAGVVYSVLTYYKLVTSNELVWAAIYGWTGVSARLAISKSQK